jgi:dolichyl-phosphate-mannose-protein mannosyltransferase
MPCNGSPEQQWRKILLERGADPNARPKLGTPWYRLACAVALGLGCGVKWSAVWYVALFAVVLVALDRSARLSAGARRPTRDALLQDGRWFPLLGGLLLLSYLATWWSWFTSESGFGRHWYAETHGLPGDRFIDPLVNLLHYHGVMLDASNNLDPGHQYQSWPWQWLLLGRPVNFHSISDVPCDAGQCVEQVLLLGTPLLWWSFLPALTAVVWLAIARRDSRAWLILWCSLAGFVPWFLWMPGQRTMFAFYALPAEPFLVLAVVYVLGAVIGPPNRHQPHSDHRLIGAIVAGAYVLLVAARFAYFYPIYTGSEMTSAEWFSRMWLGNRWI